jgi:hypothetical protein
MASCPVCDGRCASPNFAAEERVRRTDPFDRRWRRRAVERLVLLILWLFLG